MMSSHAHRPESRDPGAELPKEYRKIARMLVRDHGWRYRQVKGNHPVLYPPDKNLSPVVVPTTPGTSYSFQSFLGDLRRRGAAL